MSEVSRTTAKNYFNVNDVPTEAEFANLMDSIPFFVDATFTALSGSTWDGSFKTATLTANLALTFTSTKKSGTLIVTQDATGGRSLTINGTSITINSAANAITLIHFIYNEVNSTYIFASDLNIAGSVVGADTTPPTISSIQTLSANTIQVVFSEAVTGNGTGWAFSINGTSTTISGTPTGTGTNTYVFTITGTMASGDTILYAYNSGTGHIEDLANNPLATVGSGSVTNTLGGGVSDADAQAYITAVTTAGGTIGAPQQTALDTFFTNIKSNGVWAKTLQMNLLVHGAFARNKINMKSPGTKDFSSETDIAYASTGQSGNGTSGRIAMNIVPSTDFVNSYIAMALYCRTTGSSDVTFDMGAGVASPNVQAVLTAGWGTGMTRIDAAGLQASATTDSRGFFIASRQSDTLLTLYKDGVSIDVETGDTSNAGLPSLEADLHAFNDNGVHSLFSARELSFTWWGSALTGTEAAAFNTEFQALKTAFGF